MTPRSGRTLLLLLALVGGVSSLGLALAGAPPWLSATTFTLAGVAAALTSQRVLHGAPTRDTDVVLVESGAGEAMGAAARRERSLDLGNAVVSLRGQVTYGLMGLTLLFVGTPAVMFGVGGVSLVALPLGALFLVLVWFHWRSAWALHRSVPGGTGVSTTWPTGSLSPADRRCLLSLVTTGVLWFWLLLVLTAAAHEVAEMVALAAVAVTLGAPLALRVRRLWVRGR
ncbi:hypothetical protein ACTHAM_002036 [Cellulomonas soli]|uniref:hypothetical protein n=1 Tax=Cellulomonas soli TaxID=931535 RepID=UPI003F84F1D4